MLRQNSFRIAILICFGLVVAGLRSSAQEAQKPGSPSATAAARRDAAKRVYAGGWENHVHGGTPYDEGFFHDWSVRWMQAERDLSKTKAEEITALEEHLKRMNHHKELLDQAVKDEAAAPYVAIQAEFFRLEAEDWLAVARAGK